MILAQSVRYHCLHCLAELQLPCKATWKVVCMYVTWRLLWGAHQSFVSCLIRRESQG